MTASRSKLNSAGKRFTHQRALIMDIIRQGQGHLDADEIFRRAREKELRLSLSTVYRTLQMMKELGLVDELHFGESHHHYEVKPTKEHYHLVCLGCGRVIEFSYPLSRYLKKEVPELKDCDIDETEIRVAGYCNLCRRTRR
ncbi:MAG TPA: transcriptional repressor [Dehalococcoidales bacterium]|nr:transcriptional repressor [Dehalococcoidales bacterium]